jgi:uncharacterized protein YbaR (Trm112 family)
VLMCRYQQEKCGSSCAIQIQRQICDKRSRHSSVCHASDCCHTEHACNANTIVVRTLYDSDACTYGLARMRRGTRKVICSLLGTAEVFLLCMMQGHVLPIQFSIPVLLKLEARVTAVYDSNRSPQRKMRRAPDARAAGATSYVIILTTEPRSLFGLNLRESFADRCHH